MTYTFRRDGTFTRNTPQRRIENGEILWDFEYLFEGIYEFNGAVITFYGNENPAFTNEAIINDKRELVFLPNSNWPSYYRR